MSYDNHVRKSEDPIDLTVINYNNHISMLAVEEQVLWSKISKPMSSSSSSSGSSCLAAAAEAAVAAAARYSLSFSASLRVMSMTAARARRFFMPLAML